MQYRSEKEFAIIILDKFSIQDSINNDVPYIYYKLSICDFSYF